MAKRLDTGRRRGLTQAAVLVGLGVTLIACGALRQNLRNQFLSFRGAWQCDAKGCKQPQMVRSKKSHREGEVDISHVKMQPQVGAVFNAGAEPESFSAKVKCGGNSADVAEKRIKAPGKHKISGQADSYVVLVRPSDHDFLEGCNQIRVVAHATWENGKRTYDEEAGLQVE